MKPPGVNRQWHPPEAVPMCRKCRPVPPGALVPRGGYAQCRKCKASTNVWQVVVDAMKGAA